MGRSVLVTYDANGNLTGDSTGRTYSCDVRNKMIQAAVDGVVARYIYDAAGLRVGRDVAGGDSERYLMDLQNPTGYSQVLEQRRNGSSARSFVIGSDVIQQADGSAVSTLLYDGHGSVRAVLDATGQIATGQVLAFDAYGKVISGPTSILTPLQYAGEWIDEITGWSFNRARWYDLRGWFTQMDDPQFGNVNSPASLHKYGYAHTNPVLNVDPTGNEDLISVLAATAIGKYLISVVVGYAIGKVLTAAYLLYDQHSLREFEFFEWSDTLNLIPGGKLLAGGKIVASVFRLPTAWVTKTLTAAGTTIVGKLLTKYGVSRLAQQFTRTYAGGVYRRTLSNGATVVMEAGNRHVGFIHSVVRHIAQYYEGSKLGITTLWPKGTTPSHMMSYVDEAITKLDTALLPGISGYVSKTVTLANGILARVSVHNGKIVGIFPVSGPGTVKAIDVFNAM